MTKPVLAADSGENSARKQAVDPGEVAQEVNESSPGFALPVAAVARRLGIAPATLRTWDRRYGLGPSAHQVGSHRRYNEADLDRLSRMRQLTLRGLPPGEAAKLVLSDADAGEPPAPETDVGGRLRGGGGRVLALPDTDHSVRGAGKAAMALDSASCVTILRRELAARGLINWWIDLLVPVLTAVGERFAVTGRAIDSEHLLTECVLKVIREAADAPVPSGPAVLLASAQEEQHSLPVAILAAALTNSGVAVCQLGARLPHAALNDAVRRIGPAAVFLWSSLPETADLEQLAALRSAIRPAPILVAGGPGWPTDRLPREVRLVASLPEAIDELLAAAGR